jgi:lysophospholipase L1-like esterase
MNNRILIFGDSIAWGAWDSKGGWVNRLKNHTNNQSIKTQSENYNTIYPLGISGNNTDDLLRRFKNELKNRLDEESNIVVIIAIGINDSQFNISNDENRIPIKTFKENLNKMIEIANPVSKQILFVGLTPVDDTLLLPMPWKPTHGYSNAQIKKYNNALKELAKTKNIPLIDLYEDLSRKDIKKLLSDGLHPNTEGHEIIYNKILSELKILEVLK